MNYKKENDHPVGVGWNTGKANNFARITNLTENCTLALTLETAYFGTENNKVSEERLLALGEAFALSVSDFAKGYV